MVGYSFFVQNYGTFLTSESVKILIIFVSFSNNILFLAISSQIRLLIDMLCHISLVQDEKTVILKPNVPWIPSFESDRHANFTNNYQCTNGSI